MHISIGNDHAGPKYKEAISILLKELGHEITNYGTDSLASVDYPDFIHPVAKDVSEGKVDFGIIIF
jgi:ribose 5-phosphate isomerase B